MAGGSTVFTAKQKPGWTGQTEWQTVQQVVRSLLKPCYTSPSPGVAYCLPGLIYDPLPVLHCPRKGEQQSGASSMERHALCLIKARAECPSRPDWSRGKGRTEGLVSPGLWGAARPLPPLAPRPLIEYSDECPWLIILFSFELIGSKGDSVRCIRLDTRPLGWSVVVQTHKQVVLDGVRVMGQSARFYKKNLYQLHAENDEIK